MQNVKEMTGLDKLTRMLRDNAPPAGISVPLNFTLETAQDGHVTFTGTPLQDHVNPVGTVHGGWYGTLLDSCMACAILSRLAVETSYTTLEYKVNIIRPIPLGMPVRATGVAQHVGRSTGVASGEIRGIADDRLYATGSTTCMVLTRP